MDNIKVDITEWVGKVFNVFRSGWGQGNFVLGKGRSAMSCYQILTTTITYVVIRSVEFSEPNWNHI